MFCKKCGAQHNDGSVFCGKCGSRLDTEPAHTQHTTGFRQDPQPVCSPVPAYPGFVPPAKKLPLSKEFKNHFGVFLFSAFYTFLVFYQVFLEDRFFSSDDFYNLFYILFLVGLAYVISKCSLSFFLVYSIPYAVACVIWLADYYGLGSTLWVALSVVADILLLIMAVVLMMLCKMIFPELKKGICSGIVSSVFVAVSGFVCSTIWVLCWRRCIGEDFDIIFESIDFRYKIVYYFIVFAVSCAFCLCDTRKKSEE